MALRLRRGTDAERLTITPLEGELIYTTDTEKLYIGDGSTVGGNPVDSDSITDELSDLTDVDTTGVQNGDTLVYNLSNTRFEPGTLATAIGDLTDVDTTGVALNNILKWNGANFVPAVEGETTLTPGATYNINIDGDVTGSVFADDSTLLIDGITGVSQIQQFENVNTINIQDTVGTITDVLDINFPSGSNGSVALHARQDTPLSNNFAGTLSFVVTDSVTPNQLIGYVSATDQRIHIVCDPNGANHSYSKGFRTFADGSCASLGPLEAREGFNITSTAPTTARGASGDSAGDIAVDASYIYYCTDDYTDGSTPIWHRTAWGDETDWS